MRAYKCVNCRKEIEDGEAHYRLTGGKRMCLDCGLRFGYVGPMEWLELHGIGIYHHAEYHDGKIIAFQKWGRGYRKDEVEV